MRDRWQKNIFLRVTRFPTSINTSYMYGSVPCYSSCKILTGVFLANYTPHVDRVLLV